MWKRLKVFSVNGESGIRLISLYLVGQNIHTLTFVTLPQHLVQVRLRNDLLYVLSGTLNSTNSLTLVQVYLHAM